MKNNSSKSLSGVLVMMTGGGIDATFFFPVDAVNHASSVSTTPACSVSKKRNRKYERGLSVTFGVLLPEILVSFTSALIVAQYAMAANIACI